MNNEDDLRVKEQAILNLGSLLAKNGRAAGIVIMRSASDVSSKGTLLDIKYLDNFEIVCIKPDAHDAIFVGRWKSVGIPMEITIHRTRNQKYSTSSNLKMAPAINGHQRKANVPSNFACFTSALAILNWT